ncbi:NAD(P)-dependent oxidoreductase [Winogradskya humida]|uniref:NADH-flavin reductase n=1 Tax=Winogradskya humida TaxID=113566 RepID=A0ABQ3ZV68_9ACTN|nr:NAD(P)H-binding protein [Actinoplanes humidus]GIE22495.1 NADH-flavin reductase [Actinoplanes humidus]
MRIVIFGASGGTGRATVDRALTAGHHITAVVRRPDALVAGSAQLVGSAQIAGPAQLVEPVQAAGPVQDARRGSGARSGLAAVVVADLTDVDAVAEAVRGHDVVISALGTNAKGPVSVCADGIAGILAGMDRAGVRRLIAVSAHGAAESHDRSLYCLALWAALPHKMRDKERMEQAIRDSGTDWTVVRPAALNDKPYTGRYRTGTDLKIPLTAAVGRVDLADFLLRESATPAYLRQFPRIAA